MFSGPNDLLGSAGAHSIGFLKHVGDDHRGIVDR